METLIAHAPPADRVRANTWPEVNDRLDRAARLRLRTAADSPASIADRLERLDREWNFDRVLITASASMGLTGLALGAAVAARFLAIPAMVASMVLLHAVHGWYPLLPLFRRIGIRSQDEIDRERYGLKALRGDFDDVAAGGTPAAERAAAAWRAVCA